MNKRWLLLAVVALLGACAASLPRPGASLPGVSLEGRGREVVLSWQDDSLVTRLMRPGTTIDVVAAYPTARGPVAGDVVASTRYTAGNRAAFQLKDSIQFPPMGAICLRLRINGRSALPLRAADGGVATDGFRHDAWAKFVAINAERSELERERQSLQAAASSTDEARSNFEKWKRERGVADAADCDRINVAAASQRPSSAIEPPLQEQQTERECVWRLNRFSAQDLGGSLLDFLNVADRFLLALKKEGAESRSISSHADGLIARVKAMRAATERSLPVVTRAGFTPVVLSLPLRVTSSTEEAIAKTQMFGAISGIADAWDSCLKDTRSQLQLSYESWTKEQDPRLRQAHVRAVRAECKVRFEDWSRRLLDGAKHGDRTKAIDARLQALGPSPGIPPEQVYLMDKPCS